VVMDACLAVVFVEYIHTDEFCHYVGEGKEPSGNVKLLGKKHVTTEHRVHGRGYRKESATHESGPPPLTPTRS